MSDPLKTAEEKQIPQRGTGHYMNCQGALAQCLLHTMIVGKLNACHDPSTASRKMRGSTVGMTELVRVARRTSWGSGEMSEPAESSGAEAHCGRCVDVEHECPTPKQLRNLNQGWWLPSAFAGGKDGWRCGFRPVQAHHQVNCVIGCWQPIGFLVG